MARLRVAVLIVLAACASPPEPARDTKPPEAPAPPTSPRPVPPDSESEPPAPARSDWLETIGGGFAITSSPDGRAVSSCVYALRFKRLRDVGAPLYVRALFDNPESPASPLIATRAVAPGESEFTIASPEVRGLRKGSVYTATLELYESRALTHEIGLHVQSIQSASDVGGAP